MLGTKQKAKVSRKRMTVSMPVRHKTNCFISAF